MIASGRVAHATFARTIRHTPFSQHVTLRPVLASIRSNSTLPNKEPLNVPISRSPQPPSAPATGQTPSNESSQKKQQKPVNHFSLYGQLIAGIILTPIIVYWYYQQRKAHMEQKKEMMIKEAQEKYKAGA